MGKDVKKKSTKKKFDTKKANTKKVEEKIIINDEEKATKKIISLIIAIIIFIILLLLLVSCQKDNKVDKLKGNVKQEEVDKTTDEETKKDEEKNDSSSNKLTYISTVTKEETKEENKEESNEELSSPIVDEEENKENKEDAAKKAVEKARETYDSEDIISAEELVENLDDGEVKDELLKELEEIKEIHNTIELVEKLEEMAKDAENKEDVSDARKFEEENEIKEKIENILDEKVKEDLQERIEDLKPILEDTTDPIITGVEDGKTYNEMVKPGVIEENIRSITLNDQPYVIGEDILDGTYTFKVVDMAYNDASVSFTIDTTKAVITLNGNENIILEYMSGSYTEEGATYVDNIDGSGNIDAPSVITKDGATVSSVDVNAIGVYELEYKYTDNAGNEAVKVRTVEVKDTVLPTAKATAYYKNGKYVIILTEISEEIKENNTLEFNEEQIKVTITDINNNTNEITIINEASAPVIVEKLVSSDEYTKNYEFVITDDSDIEVVKFTKGAFAKEYFASNGEELIAPYSKEILENGEYTVYAKDKMGNDIIKTFTVSDVAASSITLNGDANITVEYKTGVYTEEGATYYNNLNAPGTISAPTLITLNGVSVASVNINEVGVYTLEYKTTDKLGNELKVERFVEVKDTVLPTAKATAYYKNGKYVIILTEVSEEITNDTTIETNVLRNEITITDINGNENTINIEKETIAPEITENKVNETETTVTYGFTISDESDIEIVKFAKGIFAKEYFINNGEELTVPYSKEILENGEYTVYAKDKMGNESIKSFNVNQFVKPVITDEELANALLVSDAKKTTEAGIITYTKTVNVNPENSFIIKEIKIVATTLEYNDITVESFKNNSIHGSDVVPILSSEFDLVDKVGRADDNYYYVYFVAEKGVGSNKTIREYVKPIIISTLKD